MFKLRDYQVQYHFYSSFRCVIVSLYELSNEINCIYNKMLSYNTFCWIFLSIFAVINIVCRLDLMSNLTLEWFWAIFETSKISHFLKRPVLNVVQLPCRTLMNLARQWHHDSTAAVSNVEPNTVAPNSKDKTGRKPTIHPAVYPHSKWQRETLAKIARSLLCLRQF